MSTTPATTTDSDGRLWAWLDACSAGAPMADAVTELARLVAEASGAERAFVVAASTSGAVVEAWGVDLDGLSIAEAHARVPQEILRAALDREGPVYQRDVDGPKRDRGAARASRLAIAAPNLLASRRAEGMRAVLVLEHRFASGAFDNVAATTAGRWATLAGVALRMGERRDGEADALRTDAAAAEKSSVRALPAALPPSHRASAPTTAFPVRVPSRAFPGIVGKSAPLLAALARLEVAIGSDLPVLIIGETGSGKELFSRALHELGPRAARELVAVNCGAIPDALFEAEFFGHARGSFTGAERTRPGLLARAERGTLLLDEIGELPMLRQASLLRALEERRYRPVGSDEDCPFDVRIVAATNKDLDVAAASGEFRRDLLYRLNTIEIRVPPLRERADDIPDLARSFLARAGSSSTLSPRAIDAMRAYAWPGNVRELEHLLQRLSLVGTSTIELAHLPRAVRAGAGSIPPEAAPPKTEREEVESALAAAGGNISRAAALLDLTRHGLKKRMVRLGMRAPKNVTPETKDAEEKAG